MTLRTLILLVALLAGTPAAAGCAVSPTVALDFASASTYDVRENRVQTASSGAGLTCTGAILTLLSSNRARATVTSANGFLLKNGAQSVPYTLAPVPSGSLTFNTTPTVDYVSATLLGLFGGGTLNPMLYATPAGAPNLPPGVYSDTVTVQWDYTVCVGVNALGICVLYATDQKTSVVTVTLTVTKDCRVTASNLSFGSAPLAASFAPVSQAVLVDCSLGTTYAVAFSAGASNVARPWRTMAGPGGQGLQYNIYRPDGTTIWDETNPLPAAGPGTGATVPAQVQGFVAKVNPAQVTPPAGTYTDTVSVVVTF